MNIVRLSAMPSEMLCILGRAAVHNVEFCNFDKTASKDAKARELVSRYKRLAHAESGAAKFEIDDLYDAVMIGGYEALRKAAYGKA